MANYVFIAASLDGYIAAVDGGLDWLNEIPNPNNSDYGYNDFISKIDAIVMGRKSYEKVLTFASWPYEKPVFVLSASLENGSGDVSNKVEIINGDPIAVVEQLKDRGYQNLYVDGGKVIQNFLNADLIDEMIISRIPILLGDGISLFGKMKNLLKFSCVKSEAIDKELEQSHYVRIP